MPAPILHLYVVRNPYGLYLKGSAWVEGVENARLYKNVGSARTQRTVQSKALKQMCTVVELRVTEQSELDDTEGYNKAREREKRMQAKALELQKKALIKSARYDFDAAKKRLEALESEVDP